MSTKIQSALREFIGWQLVGWGLFLVGFFLPVPEYGPPTAHAFALFFANMLVAVGMIAGFAFSIIGPVVVWNRK